MNKKEKKIKPSTKQKKLANDKKTNKIPKIVSNEISQSKFEKQIQKVFNKYLSLKNQDIMSINDIHTLLKIIKENILQELKKHNSVILTKFGSFNTYSRAERKGYNPSNGQSILIPEKRIIRFKFFKSAKNIVEE